MRTARFDKLQVGAPSPYPSPPAVNEPNAPIHLIPYPRYKGTPHLFGALRGATLVGKLSVALGSAEEPPNGVLMHYNSDKSIARGNGSPGSAYYNGYSRGRK